MANQGARIELENQLEEEWSSRKELKLLIEKKAFNIESVKDDNKLLRFII